MKRLSLIGLMLLAVFAVSGVTAVAASASLPELEGEKAFPEKWTGKSVGEPLLETLKGEAVNCKEATAEGEQSTSTLGSYHVRFVSCKSTGVSCNSEGSEAGVILELGEYHYVDDFLGNPKGVAILYLVNTKFKCTALVSVEVKGHELCLILEPLVLSTMHEIHCRAGSKGMEEPKEWFNDSEGKESAVLLEEKNGGAFEEAALTVLFVHTFPFRVGFRAPF